MYRTIGLMIFLLCLGLSTFGQQPQKHKKSTYVDSSGRFYINKSLPVYLRIATSPEADAPSHLLKSQQTSKYANPMFFDTEGYNTIRSPWAVDPETRKTVTPRRDIIFQVYADNRPPQIKPDFRNAEHYEDRWGSFYGKGLKIVLVGNDAVSGVDSMYYSLNGKSWQHFKDSIGFSEKPDGKYVLKYYGVDHVGNAAAMDSVTFYYDTTPAKPRVVLYGVQEGENLLSQDSKLLLRSRDSLSGERAIYYSLNDGPYKKYTHPLKVGNLPEGKHNIRYYVIDNVGNVSERKEGAMENVEYDFEVDKTPPEVEIVALGDKYQADRFYVSGRSEIKINATDSKGAVEWTRYNVNKKAQLKTYQSAFRLKGQDGWYKVYARAKDMLDNVSPVVSKAMYKDSKAPVTAIDYIHAHFFARDTLFINKDTKIKLKARDKASGVEETSYSVDNNDYTSYSEPFRITQKGPHTVNFYSTDHVNNKEQVKRSALYVDNTPPRIEVHFSVKPFAKNKVEGKTIKVYPTNTRVFVGATDKNCGTDQILFSINGSDFTNHASGRSLAAKDRFKTPKTYRVELIARDMLGNESKKTLHFQIRTK